MFFKKRCTSLILCIVFISLVCVAFGYSGIIKGSDNGNVPFTNAKKRDLKIHPVSKRDINQNNLHDFKSRIRSIVKRAQANTQKRLRRTDAYDECSNPIIIEDKERIVFIKEDGYTSMSDKRFSGIKDMDENSINKRAVKWLEEYKGVLGINDPNGELIMERIWKDNLGKWHIKFKQVYRGLDVFGSQVILHYSPFTDAFCMTGGCIETPDIKMPGEVEILSRIDAIERIRDYREGITDSDINELRLMIYGKMQRGPVLSWRAKVIKGLSLNREIFLDAITGELLTEIDMIKDAVGPASGSGEDIKGVLRTVNTYRLGVDYFLVDTEKDMFNSGLKIFSPYDIMGGIFCFGPKGGREYVGYGDDIVILKTTDNEWNDPYAVSAMYNAGLAYDYFSETFGLKSFDGEGSNIRLVIHYNKDYNNSGWTGRYILLGDGDGEKLSGLPAALDIIAHELGHAVVDNKANFVYRSQSGTLHEAYADLFGVMADRDDWTLGEDVVLSPYIAMRDFIDPSGDDLLESGPSHMNDYEDLPMDPEHDNGGVHINVGIINHATYLIAQGLGRDDTEKIYFRALESYLSIYSQFIDLRLALEESALELFGDGAKAVVSDAFSQVGISGDSSGVEKPSCNLSGEEWIIYADPTDNSSLWKIKPDGSEKERLTSTSLYGRPSYTNDGTIFFIDSEQNIRVISIDGTGEEIVEDTYFWRSITVAQNGHAYAMTRDIDILDIISGNINAEEKIYYEIIEDDQGLREIELEFPVTTQDWQGGIGYIFPWDMDFSCDGKYLVFDAKISLEIDTNDFLSYWDIYRLRLSDDVVDKPLPSLQEGQNIGNPVLGINSYDIIAYDCYFESQDTFKTYITDIQSRKSNNIRTGEKSFGIWPSLSPDNRRIVYRYIENEKFMLRTLGLDAEFNVIEGSDKGITSDGEGVEGIYPRWIIVGEGSDSGDQSAPILSYRGFIGLTEEGCFISGLR